MNVSTFCFHFLILPGKQKCSGSISCKVGRLIIVALKRIGAKIMELLFEVQQMRLFQSIAGRFQREKLYGYALFISLLKNKEFK